MPIGYDFERSNCSGQAASDIIKKELLRHKKEVLLFTDLGSGSLEYFSDLSNPIFILDHHEIHKEKLNENIKIVNPHLTDDPEGNDRHRQSLCWIAKHHWNQ